MLAASAISAGVYLGDRNRVSVGNRCVCVCVCVRILERLFLTVSFQPQRAHTRTHTLSQPHCVKVRSPLLQATLEFHNKPTPLPNPQRFPVPLEEQC